MELALVEGWVRFWFRGELLEMPSRIRERLVETQQELDEERVARLAAEDEIARLRRELARLRGEGEG